MADARLVYHRGLDGPVHRVAVEIEGDGTGQPVRLRLSLCFHQGWDQPLNTPVTDPRILNPAAAGQEHNVFARMAGREMAYSGTNAERNQVSAELPAGGALHLFLRNPGTTELSCDNPDLNRGVTVTLDRATRIALVDAPGPSKCVTAIADPGPHAPGATYGLSVRYWHGELAE